MKMAKLLYGFILLSLFVNLKEVGGKSVLEEAIELTENDAAKHEFSVLDEDPLLEEIEVDKELGVPHVELDNPRKTHGEVWSENVPILDAGSKTPREVVLTSLERSDFEHLSNDQFEKIKETELLLQKVDPSEDGPRYVDLNNFESMEFDEDFRPASMPTDFHDYDINKDGKISLEELIETTGAMENVDMAFDASDKDGDGHLNEEEFSQAPWLLSLGSDEENEGLAEDDQDLPTDLVLGALPHNPDSKILTQHVDQ